MADEPLKWSDLFGMDPNYTAGMDSARFLKHGRGECEKDAPCVLCLLDEAQAEIRRQRHNIDNTITMLLKQITLHEQLILRKYPAAPVLIEVDRVMDTLDPPRNDGGRTSREVLRGD